jgi:hypothetical protein
LLEVWEHEKAEEQPEKYATLWHKALIRSYQEKYK